jgi:hypothetical protein
MADSTTMEREELLHVQKPVSRVSWGGIIAGAIATIALGMLFFSLGAAIGLTSLNPGSPQGGSISPVASGIWLFLSIVVATFLGAWIGARHSTLFMRRDAMAQGTIIWALSLLLAMVYVGWAGSTMAHSGSQLAGATLQSAGNVAGGGMQALPQTNIPNKLQQQYGSQADQQQLQQQLKQQASQLQQPFQQAIGAVADAGAAFSWWFFITGVFGLGAGILGGLAGLPGPIRKRQMETRRQLRQTESHA